MRKKYRFFDPFTGEAPLKGQKVSYPPEVVFIEISSYYSSALKCSDTTTCERSLPARRVQHNDLPFNFELH